MKAGRKELEYASKHFNEVHHTTINPEGPGVVRIHFIPSMPVNGEMMPGVVIVNGQDLIPINGGWNILLAEFIDEVNTFDGREISEEEFITVLNRTVKTVKKIYPFIPKQYLKNDLYRLMNLFKQIAYREKPDEDVEFMSIGDYAPLMKAPHRMDLLVSAMEKDGKWNCNQKCIHCYAAGQKCANETELNTEEWIAIIDKCRKIGIPQLTFTGGEPTMRDDLFELIDAARWFVTRLNTNGIKLTEEYCEKLKSVSLDSMQITFYSDEEEIHNKLVGAPMYEKTLEGIKNALHAGISVSINTPLCTLNKNYVKTLAFLHSLGVLYVTCSGIITTGNALKESSEELQLTTQEMKTILKDAVAYCAGNGMEISFTSPGWIETKFFDEIGINPPTCGACLSNMAITPSGKTVPCQSWLNSDHLGDFLYEDWEKIWNSPACVRRKNFSAQMEGTCPLRKYKDVKNAGEEDGNNEE